MTKPIEGWVAWHPWFKGFNRDNTCKVHGLIQGAEYELRRESNNKRLKADLWQVRPVKITFTDTAAEDLIKDYDDDGESTFKQLEKMYDYVESLAPELNGYIEPEDAEKIQNALRKDRDRIYAKLKELNSDDNPFFRGVRNGQIHEAIFGEEK